MGTLVYSLQEMDPVHFDAIPVAVSVFNGTECVAQNAAAANLGLTSPEAIFGKLWDKVLRELRRNGCSDPQQIQRGKAWYKLQAKMTGKHMVVSQTDVTDAVTDLNRRESVFRRVCHDLRAPLHGIVGLAEDIAHKAKQQGSNPLSAEAILNTGQRLVLMINDILDASKLKAGKMGLSLSSVSLKKEVEKIVYSFRSARDQSTGETLIAPEVTLRNDVPVKTPLITADRHRLSQVLYNIIGNACKFTRSGFVKVSARKIDTPREENTAGAAETATLASGWLAISVEDTGVGIKSENFGRLFEEFEQADNSDGREFIGTGLGLSICKELVELHGGRISVESEVGVGTTFTFTLPLSAEPESVRQVLLS